jgi:2-keto-3-deoxy-L-rhamnonate aldolase RhmA
MRLLQQSEIATLSMLKSRNSKEGAYTRDADEVSIVVLTVIEEADHSLGQILMVVGVRDEVSLGAMDTFAAEQGADGKTAEDLENNIIREAAQYVPLVGGLLHFVNVQYDELPQ